jgi:uncharacterized protein YbaR (Trm112 family)
MEKNKCLKCRTETGDIHNEKTICPVCGLTWKVEDSGEWIIYGNLNLAWNQYPISPIENVKFPRSLTIHGDLNMMGCKNYVCDSCESLTVNGNIFMCNSNLNKLPAKDFEMNGVLYCRNTIFHDIHNEYIVNEKNEEKKPFYTRNDIQNILNFKKLKKKLPELEGIF